MRAIHLSANLPEHFRGQAILWVVRWGSFQEIFWGQEGGGGVLKEGYSVERVNDLPDSSSWEQRRISIIIDTLTGWGFGRECAEIIEKESSRVCSAVKYLGPSRPWGLKISQFFSVCLDPVKKEWCSMINLEAIYMLIDHNIFSTGLFHVKKM